MFIKTKLFLQFFFSIFTFTFLNGLSIKKAFPFQISALEATNFTMKVNKIPRNFSCFIAKNLEIPHYFSLENRSEIM